VGCRRTVWAILFAAGCSPPSPGPPVPPPPDLPRLISIDPAVVELRFYRCFPRYDSGRRRAACHIFWDDVEVQTNRVLYLDEQGIERLVHDPDPWSDPRVAAGLCETHLEQPVRVREAHARRLLWAADDLWSIDCDTSIRLYQRLVKDYPEFLLSLGARMRATKRAEQID